MKIIITKKGIADSLQNAGNYGHQHIGVQVGGFIDFYSAQLANKIVGNSVRNSLFEIHFPSSQFLFEEDGYITITGANFIPVINEKSIPMYEVVSINKGDTLQFLQPIKGRIAYLAMNKTNHNTNKIKKDFLKQIDRLLFTPYPLRFIPGPAWNELSETSINTILQEKFLTTLQSNRMGFHLAGPRIVTKTNKSYLSSGVTRGTMQLLPNGQIIILMPDHQTIGGYPNIGQIILVDLPRLAQMAHNMPIQFRLCNVSTAHEQYQFIQTQFSN